MAGKPPACSRCSISALWSPCSIDRETETPKGVIFPQSLSQKRTELALNVCCPMPYLVLILPSPEEGQETRMFQL